MCDLSLGIFEDRTQLRLAVGKRRGTLPFFFADRSGLPQCISTRRTCPTRAAYYPAVSKAMAMPWPTPMHIVASARLPPFNFISNAAVPAIRAPDMPSG